MSAPADLLDRFSTSSDLLVCPITKQPLRAMSLAEAEAAGDGTPFVPRERIGPATRRLQTDTVMLRADQSVAYPIVDGIPVLLAPEALVRSGSRLPAADVTAVPYGEAYQEMKFYNEFAAGAEGEAELSRYAAELEPLAKLEPRELESFPEPKSAWLDAVYDAAAQMDCYQHLAPIAGRTLVQLGGKGIHAVKFLMGGAAEAWVVSPMMEEIRWALAFARRMQVSDRLRCVVAICEELPFKDAVIDGMYVGGTVHHLHTPTAMPEVRRVLVDGGRFAAAEPWQAPGYVIGTRIFGKRERNAYCRPLDSPRVAPLLDTFPTASVQHHGGLTRYPLLALFKVGIRPSLDTIWKIGEADDALLSALRLRRIGSSVALLAVK